MSASDEGCSGGGEFWGFFFANTELSSSVVWQLLDVSLAYSDELLNVVAAACREIFPGKSIWMTEYNAGLTGGILNGSVHALFQVKGKAVEITSVE